MTEKEKVKYDLQAYFKAEKSGATPHTFKAPYGSLIEESSGYVCAIGNDYICEYDYANGSLRTYLI